MFGKSIRLFSLFGFEVKLDYSWVILAFLITWTLASGWFPANYEGFAQSTYWWMGAAGAVGLFLSIVFHELAHSVVARKYGIPMRGITLFIFGGVAEMESEPPNAKSEFLMAIAGPIASIILGGIFFAGESLLQLFGSQPLHAVLSYLAGINILLAAFNLVPAFPLDGGRVLRSGLWAWKKNLQKATRIASFIGSGFGLLLIGLGIFSFFGGNMIGGVWWFLIGMFLFKASRFSYRRVVLRKTLKGEDLSRFIEKDPITVPPTLSISEFVESYIYRYQQKIFPVVDNSHFIGWIGLEDVKEIPQDQWREQTVGDIAEKVTQENTIDVQADAQEALAHMKKMGSNRIMVVDNSHLIGIVRLEDMVEYFETKMELENDTMN